MSEAVEEVLETMGGKTEVPRHKFRKPIWRTGVKKNRDTEEGLRLRRLMAVSRQVKEARK